MGPINSLDPPARALSKPSNGKDTVSVRDWCQRFVKLAHLRKPADLWVFAQGPESDAQCRAMFAIGIAIGIAIDEQ